jgi:hypothetical protein
VRKTTRVAAIGGALLIALTSAGAALASSHREAPLISNDPSADHTDLYAWVDEHDATKVNILVSVSPMQDPAGGPNFWRFDPSVRYEIHIDNDRDARPDVTYRFNFHTTIANGKSFLYNSLPVTSPGDPDLNVRQTYRVTKIKDGATQFSASGFRTLPTNVGARSTPDFEDMVDDAVYSIGPTKVFAGQTDDAFFVDLGSIFDLGGLRPFNSLHVLPLADANGNDDLQSQNVLTFGIQVPITALTRDGKVHAAGESAATIGIWAANYRQAIRVLAPNGSQANTGPWVQVSRLGNPLINEVIIPLGRKDYWNRRAPSGDSLFETYYLNPELAAVANFVYPALDNAATTGRGDLSLILLNGLPGVNNTGTVKADMLRLNTGIPPCTADPADDDMGSCRRLGAFYDDAADLAAWPNGRRLSDDVTDMAVRAVIEGYGATLNGLFGVPNRTPNNLIGDGVGANDVDFGSSFPYMGVAEDGYDHIHHGPNDPL